jgi:hypothetical protein
MIHVGLKDYPSNPLTLITNIKAVYKCFGINGKGGNKARKGY